MKKPILNHKGIAHFILLPIILTLFVFSVAQASVKPLDTVQQDPVVIGRWDLTIDKDGKSLPSWFEVQKSGSHHILIGRFVYAFGSARPISEVRQNDGKYSFSIPPQW